MISAWKIGTTEEVAEFHYHGESATNTVGWTLFLNEDGTCSAAPAPSGCTIELNDGSSLKMSYDQSS